MSFIEQFRLNLVRRRNVELRAEEDETISNVIVRKMGTRVGEKISTE
jgi:hypothetical protein